MFVDVTFFIKSCALTQQKESMLNAYWFLDYFKLRFLSLYFVFKTWMKHLVIYVPVNNMMLMLQERCAGADTVALVSRLLHRSRTHLQSLLLMSNSAVVEDFFVHLVYFSFSIMYVKKMQKLKLKWFMLTYILVICLNKPRITIN